MFDMHTKFPRSPIINVQQMTLLPLDFPMKEDNRNLASAVLDANEKHLEPIKGVPMGYVGFESNFSFHGKHPGSAVDVRNVMPSPYDIAT